MAADIIEFKPIKNNEVEWDEFRVITCGNCHSTSMTLICKEDDPNVYMVCNKCDYAEVL